MSMDEVESFVYGIPRHKLRSSKAIHQPGAPRKVMPCALIYHWYDVAFMQTMNSLMMFRFVDVQTVNGEKFPSREAWSKGLILSSCVGRDDLVICHNALVGQDGDLVNVGDYVAYQSNDENKVHSENCNIRQFTLYILTYI